jgi:predicted DNA-binding transcriptional regulator YafY
MLSLLQTRREWSGPDLAERLEVDVRTVRRDVERLRSLGYPVHATPGVSGGYRLGAGAAPPPLLLDDDEAVAMAVSLTTAAGGSVTGIEETSLRALTKLEQVLPSRLRHRVKAMTSVLVSLGSHITVDPAMLTTIAAACRDHQRLRFGYSDSEGVPSGRTVEPFRLACSAHRWYLLAFDVDRQAWRTFRLDRLDGGPVLGARFTPREPPSEDVAEYLKQAFFGAPHRYVAMVTVQGPADVVAEQAGDSAALVEAVDENSCVLHVGGWSPAEITVYLSRISFDFQVDGPPELVARLRLVADRFVRAVTH